jgi:hypothetical protein
MSTNSKNKIRNFFKVAGLKHSDSKGKDLTINQPPPLSPSRPDKSLKAALVNDRSRRSESRNKLMEEQKKDKTPVKRYPKHSPTKSAKKSPVKKEPTKQSEDV